jgi:SAM-dependent methyltransferase
MENNKFTNMQKSAYSQGTSNHLEHNDNPDYWDILLGDLKDKKKWKGKYALDFACGKGRNVTNMLSLADWVRVDGIDISEGNIQYCKETYDADKSHWFCNNGIDLADLESDKYSFAMSTIALQHIPVYSIRKNIITEIFRTLEPGGLFSFQMGYGSNLDDSMGRPRSAYYEDSFDAGGTNSLHDVRIQSEAEVIDDLKAIGFTTVETFVRDTFSDYGHPQWIYVKAYKSL